ncbi:MAG: MMPL family transporter, partial [Fibrobacter sp.]|nr:MMPL family transporter [Fibrobacter sp.]
MLKKYINVLLRFRYLILSLLFALTIFFGYFLTHIQVDNDTFKAIPPDLKAKIDYDILKQHFSAPYTVLFLAEFKTGSLTEKIDSIRSWENEISEIDGISGVTDLNTVQIPLKGGFFGITSDYLISQKQALGEEELRERIKNNKEFSKIFISDDESILGMIIGLQNGADRSFIIKNIISKVEQINSTQTIKSYITSEGAISYFIDQAMRNDFRLLLPICMIVVFLLLYRIFRNVLFVCTALLVNVFALLWTFGIMGMLNVSFSVVTTIIPVILFPIGVADAIHLLKLYKEELAKQRGNIENALVSTYKELIGPCLLTSLTTFAGFASFSFSSISWTRTFGIFTGIAILFAYIFNIV